MSRNELTQRTKETIILHGPDAWKQPGYFDQAQRTGLPLEQAVALANTIVEDIRKNQDRITRFQTAVTELYERRPTNQRTAPPDEPQLQSWLADLHPVDVSENFVRKQWIPTLIDRLPSVVVTRPAPVIPELSKSVPVLVPPSPEPRKMVIAQPVLPIPIPPIPETQYRRIPPVDKIPQPPAPEPPSVDSPPPPLPQIQDRPPVVRMFKATPTRARKGQDVRIEWEVENLLAVTIDEMGEGLSLRGYGFVQPTQTTSYTLFDVNNNALKTIRVEIVRPPVPSGLYGALFAVFLLAVAYWSTQNINSGTTTEPVVGASSRGSGNTPKPVPKPPVTPPSPTSTVGVAPGAGKPLKKPVIKPVKPHYDVILDNKGQYGERQAQLGGKWGLWKGNGWLIKPKYKDISLFGNDRATVTVSDDEQYDINRAGEQIR